MPSILGITIVFGESFTFCAKGSNLKIDGENLHDRQKTKVFLYVSMIDDILPSNGCFAMSI